MSPIVTDPAAWDSTLAHRGGHLLQSWRWGAFKERHGWRAKRLAVDGAMAQVLYRHRGPVSIGYVPRGPAWQDAAGIERLLAEIDASATHHRAIWTSIEADAVTPWHDDHARFARGTMHFQPARTVIVPLLDDEALLDQMHSKTRYSVRLAQRRGVSVERVDPLDTNAVDSFYEMLQDTSGRNTFGIHSREYYGDFLREFQEDVLLIFARISGERAAALIAARFGSLAIYMYGASSTDKRAHGAAFLLQFEAMRWAREAGMTAYDLWGIPADAGDDGGTDGELQGAAGLLRFKTGFGGSIVEYPPTLDRVHHKMLTRVAMRVLGDRV